MSAMKWTPAQEDALTARGENLLLSAAAGSGKTAVLVERVIRRITDPTDPVDVNAFLVLTFTRAAAAEMRSRIADALSKRLSEASDALEAHPTEENAARVAYLQRQITLLGSAAISTIDSFCQTLLKQYFYLVDFDPNFRILSDANAKRLLQDDVLSEVLLNWYEKDDPRFRDVLNLLAYGYGDEALREAVLRIYEFSRSLPFPEAFLRRFAEPYTATGTSISDFPWTAPFFSYFQDQAASWADQYRAVLPILDEDPALDPWKDPLSEEYAALSALSEESEPSWSTWQRTVTAIQFAKLPSTRKKNSTDPLLFDARKEEIKAARKAVKDHVKKLRDKWFSVPEAQWISDMNAARPIAEVLSELVLDFGRAYWERKKKEGLLEFNDTEHLVLRLLLAEGSTPDHPIPSETALTLRQKYREVMVDEYQDTNGLQEIITALLSDGKNRFLVGDIKQSIYRFRQADPGIFLKKYQTYAGGTEGRRIDLNQNFRSDNAVLAAVNFIFGQIMQRLPDGRTPLELEYGDAEALHPGRGSAGAPPSYLGGTVDIDIIDMPDAKDSAEDGKEDLNQVELEARMVARRIAALSAAGSTVMEKDGTFRPMRYEDIAILLRAVDKKAAIFQRVLREQGIPSVTSQTDDFFASEEVQILWSVLKILDNPRQDLALTAVLRSPLVGLNEESLARLRLADRESLWTALPHATDILSPGQAMAALRFRGRYRAWRELSRKAGAAPLIETILADTDFLSYISGMQGSAFRRAHVQAFYETARTWDSQGIGGLSRFLTYLQRTADSDLRLTAAAAPPAAGAVHIMSVHKSKGLEFPVVFLCCTGSAFNTMDLKKPVLLHKDKGIGIPRFDRDHLCRWDTLYYLAVGQQIKEEQLAEEARLLYVAMTRARDRLIITGAKKKASKAFAAMTTGIAGSSGFPPLPAYRITSAKNYLDWILPAAARSRSMESFWEVLDKIPAYIAETGDAAPHFSFTLHSAAEFLAPDETVDDIEDKASGDAAGEPPVTADPTAFLRADAPPAPAWVDRQLRWAYPHPGAAAAPAKLTATAAVQLAEEAKEEYMPSRILAAPLTEKAPLPADFAAPPLFLSARGPQSSGASYGTLMHRAMEELDLAHLPADEEAIAREIRRLAAAHLFTEEEAALLLDTSRRRRPTSGILAFLESPLGRLMREADTVRKEMPFSLLLPAAEFFPDCEDESIFLQGAIDCLLENKGRITIIDYKTDRISDGRLLAEHYHRQLQIYGNAAERLFQKPVDALYLWSFHLNQAIPVPRM